MNISFKRIIIGFIILNFALLESAAAMDIMSFTGNYSYSSSLKSVKELRNEKVVRQGYDFNCAASSLATLLNYQYGEKFSEVGMTNALVASVKRKNRAKIRKRGFSLSEIKRVSEALDYKGEAYTFDTLEELKKVNYPSIVRVVLNGVPHFVVVKKIENGHVFLADPAWGNRSMTYYQFLNIWERRFAFFVLPKNRKLGDERLVNAFSKKTPIVDRDLYTQEMTPDVWLQQDIDSYIITTVPYTFSK